MPPPPPLAVAPMSAPTPPKKVQAFESCPNHRCPVSSSRCPSTARARRRSLTPREWAPRSPPTSTSRSGQRLLRAGQTAVALLRSPGSHHGSSSGGGDVCLSVMGMMVAALPVGRPLLHHPPRHHLPQQVRPPTHPLEGLALTVSQGGPANPSLQTMAWPNHTHLKASTHIPRAGGRDPVPYIH